MCKSSFQKSMSYLEKLNSINGTKQIKYPTGDKWLSTKFKEIEDSFFQWLSNKTTLSEDYISDDDIDIKPYIEYILDNERASK
jgi:hypothetical protein